MLRNGFKNVVARLQTGSALAWIVAGFLLSYILFFVYPVFLSGTVMRQSAVVPSVIPIGWDLLQTMSFVRAWLTGGGSPYVGTAIYPPMTYVLLQPLLWLDPGIRYVLWTSLTLLMYVVGLLWMSLRSGARIVSRGALLMVLAAGLVSYGLQFELERGQFNVIAVTLAYAAGWLFHRGHRFWAYILFSIAVQLKLYPFIFIVLMIEDWRNWRENIRRVLLLGVANVGLLFVMGYSGFVDFVTAMGRAMGSPRYIATGDHSIHVFVSLLGQSQLVEYGLIGLVFACVLLVLWSALSRGPRGVDPSLLFACALAACLLPSLSVDYKLAILACPAGFFFSTFQWNEDTSRPRLGEAVALLVVAIAYSATLFPPADKPSVIILQDNLPMLFTALIALTWLTIWRRAIPGHATPTSDTRSIQDSQSLAE